MAQERVTHGDYNANFHLPYDPARITPEAFVDVCKQQSIAFLVAAYTDPVWHVKDSWVWKETPVFANPTATCVSLSNRGAGVESQSSRRARCHDRLLSASHQQRGSQESPISQSES